MLSATGSAKDAFDALERNARYSACAKFCAGFALGSGLDNASAARYALDTCAVESGREIVIDDAPDR